MKIPAEITNFSVGLEYRLDMWVDGCAPNQVDFTDEADAFWHCFVEKKESRIILPFRKEEAKKRKNGRENRQVWSEREKETKTRMNDSEVDNKYKKEMEHICPVEKSACLSVSVTMRVKVYYKESTP